MNRNYVLIGIFIVIAVLIIFSLSKKTLQQDSSFNVKKCIENLTDYYSSQQGIISIETGKIIIGANRTFHAQVIEVSQDNGAKINSTTDYSIVFNVEKGKEIEIICKISNDERVAGKISWAEPDIKGIVVGLNIRNLSQSRSSSLT